MILIVEDNAAIRELFREALETVGHKVLCAETAPDGLALFDQHSAEINVAVVDVGLPGFDGYELAERILEIRPSARVLLTSGHSRGERLDHHAGRVWFLQKPYTIRSLRETIQEMIQSLVSSVPSGSPSVGL